MCRPGFMKIVVLLWSDNNYYGQLMCIMSGDSEACFTMRFWRVFFLVSQLWWHFWMSDLITNKFLCHDGSVRAAYTHYGWTSLMGGLSLMYFSFQQLQIFLSKCIFKFIFQIRASDKVINGSRPLNTNLITWLIIAVILEHQTNYLRL